MAKIPKISNNYQNLKVLQNNKFWAYVYGDTKGYKKASQEFAKEAIKDFDTAKEVMKQSPKMSAPLFSKLALRSLKVWFLEKFRIKTPEEKELIKLAKAEKEKQKLKINA